MGCAGLLLLWRNPGSSVGSLLFKLFLFQAFLVLTIIPHEFGHALVARWLGIDVQRVSIGFGPTLFSARWLRFEVDFRSVPLGGVTVLGPAAGLGRWLLTRHFLVILAGPLANLLLAAVAGVLHPSFAWIPIGGPVHTVQLFAWANLLVAAQNLIPFVVTSSYGRIPSDGLGMLQILRLRRLPHVPSVGMERKRTIRVVERTLPWIAAVFLLLCCLICLGLVVMIVTLKSPRQLWWAAGILFSMAAALAWLSWRALSAPLFPKPGTGGLDGVGHAALAELEQFSPWPEGVSPPVLAAEVNDLVQAARFDEALACIDQHLARTPTNLLLRLWKVSACTVAGRLADAEWILHDLLQQPALGAACRAELLMMRLSLVFKQAHQDRVAPLVETFLQKDLPMAVRVRVLDYLACVPFMEGHRHYLAEADNWSQQLVALQPQNLTLKGTRGALLVEQGRFDEAEPLLNEVYAASEADIDRGISSLYLAIIGKHRGHHDHARSLAKRARRIFRAPWLIQRVQQEFPDLPD